MDNNIYTFPTPEGAKIGFYELDEIANKFQNLFNQTLDPDRALNSDESITSVISDVQNIENEIGLSIDAIDGLRPGMPTPEEFQVRVWDLLCMPLAFGKDRAGMENYETAPAYWRLVEKYNNKRTELKEGAL